ncbi:MAG: redoxin family protein [Balneola sp.]
MKHFLVLFLSIITFNSESFAQVNEGEKAPDFTLTSLQNEQIKLSELEGKVVYIFFFGANCPHCRDNGPITEDDIYQNFKDNENFVALGLDTWNTSAAEVTNFKNITGITYSLLLNARQSLVDYYGNSSAYDRSVVIDKTGKIAYKGTGFVNSDYEEVNESIENELSVATSNEDSFELPNSVLLKQNFPNPFNPSTSISYTIPEAADVSLKIYNMLGVEVATIEKGFINAGEHTATFDASSLSSGIYIYRLTAGATTLTKKMTLLK